MRVRTELTRTNYATVMPWEIDQVGSVWEVLGSRFGLTGREPRS